MRKLLAWAAFVAMSHAVMAQTSPVIVVPSSGQVPAATPAGQQQLINGTPWINGRGQLQGPNWRDNYQLVHDILNGMGTWNAQGVYTPNPTSFSNLNGSASANQLPLSGIAAGSYGDAQHTLSPVIDQYGRVTSVAQNLIAATQSATGDASTNAYLTPRTFQDWMKDHATVLDYGAKCDNATDDAPAIQAALSAFRYSARQQYHLELPEGMFCRIKEPLYVYALKGDFGGSGGPYSGHLIWAGASNVNVLNVGGGAGALNGVVVTSIITKGTGNEGVANVDNEYLYVHDITLESATKMTAGAAFYETNAGHISLNNVYALGNAWWDGFDFRQVDYTRLTNFLAEGMQNDCVSVAGNGAEGNPATAPQYDLFVDGGKTTGCNIGLHVGGGFDGAWFDHIEDTTNTYNAVVDEIILGFDGKAHPNQEVVFGPQVIMGFAQWDNVLINEPDCTPRIFCSVSIYGPVTVAGGLVDANGRPTITNPGLSGTVSAGLSAPANAGNGVHIKSMPGGQVVVKASYMDFFANAAVLTEDNAALLFMDSAVAIYGAKYGVASTVATWNYAYSLPAGILNGVATAFDITAANLLNVRLPDMNGSIAHFTSAYASGSLYASNGTIGYGVDPGPASGVLFTTTGDVGIKSSATGASGCTYLQNATGALTSLRGCIGAGMQVPKLAAAPSAGPGPGYLSLFAVPGTNAGTCKLQVQSGTSATASTIADNVGSGC